MMLQAALAALAKGFWIFPVARNDKIPHRSSSWVDAAGVMHGWGETATNDINQVVRFWTHVDPQANVGIACKPSQLLVIDLDKAKEDYQLRDTEWAYMHGAYGPRVDGEALFDEMMFKAGSSDSTDLDTYTVTTRSGGIHLYYRWPTSWPKTSQASPVKGIVDVRGNGGRYGGYVLAEGSQVGGKAYEGRPGTSISLPPAWIRQLVVEKPPAPRIQRPRGLMQPGVISFAGLVETVRNAGEGNRNNALHYAARAMYSDKASLETAKDTLGPAAREAGLHDFEIDRTIESGYRAQQQKEG